MTWEIAILKAYALAGGCATNRTIYNTVGKFITLTSEHTAPTVHGGRPAYEHQVRSHISNLYEAGHLRQVSRGHYCLTATGQERI